MIYDNLNSYDDLVNGIESKSNSLLGHVLYTRKELNEGTFYQEMFNRISNSGIRSIIDVGGCTGEFTKKMMEIIPSIEKAIIVEPLSSNFHFIKYRFSHEKRIQVVKKCVYYDQDSLKLHIPKCGNVGGACGVMSEKNSSDYEVVDVIPIESLPIYDFIKIDVEGAEWRIIENSTNLKKFKYIQLEFHNLNGWHSYREWHKFVKEHLPDYEILVDGNDCYREWGGSWFEQVLLKNKNI